MKEIKYNDRRIHITNNLVKKLLEGKEIFIDDKQSSCILLPEENEELRDLISAKILKGSINEVISIELQKASCLPNQKRDYYKIENYDIYESEEIYRLPLIKDIQWLKKGLQMARRNSHSYFMNEM